ncbi:MAG TPA: ABC transporter permease [Gemmatimonadaceae bacterium]|nr:ABC transporter permease [Gemmatimonadaceae bacterium]
MRTLLEDLRYAVRLLAKNPVFTGVVVLTLALGIGLNTAVFSVIDGLLLRPLPGTRAPNELVQLYRSYRGDVLYGSNSIPHYFDLRDRTHDTFSGVALWDFEAFNLAAGGRNERVMGVMASANFFSVLGVNPARGRMFLPAEDSGRGAHPVAVLSWSTWKGAFGGDEAIVGRSIVLNGRSYSIVGVTPQEFRGALPLVIPAIWVPLSQFDDVRPHESATYTSRGNNSFNVVARLKPGVTSAQARDRMKALVAGLRAEHPQDYDQSGITVVPQPEAGIHPEFKSAQVALSSVVMAVVGVLLLIACVNVANLFLARARDRAREMAIRISLGARRSRLVQQLLTESLLFAGASGLAGVGLAWWVIRIANTIRIPMEIDFSADLHLSPLVVAFAFGASVLTGLLFGLAPALQATRPSLVPALKGDAPAGQSRSRASKGLVVVQMALSIVLLVSAGLFLRDLQNVTTVDKGFIGENLLLADLAPGLQGYNRARSEDLYRRIRERLVQLPNVKAVGYTATVPLGLSENDSWVEIAGYTPAKNENMSLQNTQVTPGYFEAMGIPLKEGRAFTDQDDSASVRVMMVNERMAKKYWPGTTPIGKTVKYGGKEHTVIGVVPTGKYSRLGEPPTPFYYLAQAQHWNEGMSIAIRTTGDPNAVAPALRAAASAFDETLPVSGIRTMTRHLGIALMPARLAGAALGVFGILGLVLASVGMYGVMSYTVSQRRREIGIRMAIGAATGDVVGMILRQGLTLVIIGAAIGIGGALGASQLLRGILYSSSVVDPVTFAGVPLLLTAVAALASWLPARRASRVDPLDALRRE